MNITLYHALNRGVEGRNLFIDSSDYVRFVHNLYEFNDASPAHQSDRRPGPDVGFTKPNMGRKKLVDVHGWCLMKNHYHLLLSERREGGLSLFLRKINVGYANYFNERYERHGTLFQSRTKKILIDRPGYFLYVLHYIHLNPLDYVHGAEQWRLRSKTGIRNTKRALEALGKYRWSSFLDYNGKKNFPSILTTSLFGNKQNYIGSLKTYLKDAEQDLSDTEMELE